MLRQERMLAPEAFDAFVVWPQDFSRFLFEETMRLVKNDVTDRLVTKSDIVSALPEAFRRLQAAIEPRLKGPHFEIARKAA